MADWTRQQLPSITDILRNREQVQASPAQPQGDLLGALWKGGPQNWNNPQYQAPPAFAAPTPAPVAAVGAPPPSMPTQAGPSSPTPWAKPRNDMLMDGSRLFDPRQAPAAAAAPKPIPLLAYLELEKLKGKPRQLTPAELAAGGEMNALRAAIESAKDPKSRAELEKERRNFIVSWLRGDPTKLSMANRLDGSE